MIDILGFLTFEIVCSLTETALKIKQREQVLQTQRTNPSNLAKIILTLNLHHPHYIERKDYLMDLKML